MMQVRVISFGILKDWMGSSAKTVELPEGASVGELLGRLGQGAPGQMLKGIAVSVNAEYATANQVLKEGDEVGLLPPVSGGCAEAAQAQQEGYEFTSLTREPISAQAMIAEAKCAEDGAVVVFDGIVRDNSRGRRTLHLDYDAYEEMAAKQLQSLAIEARSRFGVRHVTIVHRLGRLQIGETSVLIVVASAHRAQAFEACRWVIDTLKKTVPIWKKETFADGAVWAPGEPFPADLAVDGAEAKENG
ncbi:MAG TPA: molybdenum cofactor biosynthesis protein MoaE [Terracidiphilus sp.]|nr:molybdenum cofactor biosynthesis protein MoaE [Terracidiphilus sp.]